MKTFMHSDRVYSVTRDLDGYTNIVIRCESNKARNDLGWAIHRTYQGFPAYVNSDILLNIDTPKTVFFCVKNYLIESPYDLVKLFDTL